MVRSRKLNKLVLLNGAILVGVAIPHLIDDFLYGIPEEFGLTNMVAQALSGLFSVLLSVRRYEAKLSREQLELNVQRYIDEIEKLSVSIDRMKFNQRRKS